MMKYTENGANSFSGSTAVKNDTIQIITFEARVATSYNKGFTEIKQIGETL